LDVSVGNLLFVIKLEKENVIIYFFECVYEKEEIKPGSDVAKAEWVSLEEMEKYKLRPAMYKVIGLLSKTITKVE
jgi:hypothetical protein